MENVNEMHLINYQSILLMFFIANSLNRRQYHSSCSENTLHWHIYTNFHFMHESAKDGKYPLLQFYWAFEWGKSECWQENNWIRWWTI